jgi:hypothetical protein
MRNFMPWSNLKSIDPWLRFPDSEIYYTERVAAAVTHVDSCVCVVLGSNLLSGYLPKLLWFLAVAPAKYREGTMSMPWTFPSKSFPINKLSGILPFHAV